MIVVGLNHRTVPLDLLERMTVPAERLPKALHDLVSREHLTEAVVLSTCNRTEVYAVAERYHGAMGDVALNQPIMGTLEIVSFIYMVGCTFLPLAHVQLSRTLIIVDGGATS